MTRRLSCLTEAQNRRCVIRIEEFEAERAWWGSLRAFPFLALACDWHDVLCPQTPAKSMAFAIEDISVALPSLAFVRFQHIHDFACDEDAPLGFSLSPIFQDAGVNQLEHIQLSGPEWRRRGVRFRSDAFGMTGAVASRPDYSAVSRRFFSAKPFHRSDASAASRQPYSKADESIACHV